MKKSSKRVLLVSLSLLCVFFFTACNSGNGNEKVYLAAPTGLSINRQANTITWDAVENAKGYTVKIDGAEYDVDDTFFSLKNIIIDVIRNIQVRAESYKFGKKSYVKSDYCQSINFFDIYRIDRNESRQMTLSYLDEIINNEESLPETIEAACNERVRLFTSWEKELVIEGLIKAQGFEDCAAAFTNETINIIVKKAELTESECQIIFDIVIIELNIPKENIRIIPIA